MTLSIIPRLPSILIALQIPLIHLTNILCLAISPSHQAFRLAIAFPVLVLLLSQSLYREWSGGYGIRYAMECAAVSGAWCWFDWVVLKSPDRERWRKIKYDVEQEKVDESGGDVKETAKDEVPQRFWARAWWAVRFVMGTRYVGWTQQVKNVPVEVDSGYSRWRFVLRKASRAVWFYIVADLITSYTASTPHGSWLDITDLKPTIPFAHSPFWTRFWLVWVHIFMTYAEMEKANAAYGVVSVATDLAKPQDCPSMFGDLKELYTVRKAWSFVWHQNIRRICAAPGTFLVRDMLHLRKGSFASKYLQLFVGFGVSGIVHGGATMLTHGKFFDDGSLAYFLGQAVAIMVEDQIIDLGKKLGFKDSVLWRLCGCVWTVLFIGASTQRFTGAAVDYGMWIHERRSDWFGVGPRIVA